MKSNGQGAAMLPAHLVLPTYRADIDGLRAIAVLAVVGFHAFPGLVHGGFIGVDVFFVVSGYLISTLIFASLRRGSFRFTEFYGRRIRRIFPALLLVLAASLALGWYALLPGEFSQLALHVAGGAGFVSNLVLQNEGGYFDGAAQSKPLLHLWSLGIEEQYYIVWPFLLWLAWRYRLNARAAIIAIGAVSFAVNVGLLQIDPIAAFYAPHARFWELLAGSALAYAAPIERGVHAALERRRDLLAWLGAAMVAAGFLLTTKDQPFPGWLALLPTGGTVLVISAGRDAWLNRTVLANPALVWIGLISYPLYLWHWPLLSFASVVEGGVPAPWIRVAAVAISVVLAWLTYRLVERPVRFGKYGKAAAVALSVLMVAAGCTGYEIHRREGLPSRFPEIVRELARDMRGPADRYRAGSCLLYPAQDYSAFGACDSNPATANAAAIVLWGDSHAAHLYAGYRDRYGERFNLMQRTAANCPPIPGIDIDKRPHCRNINEKILELIRRVKPERVVLAAAWNTYEWRRLESTVTKLRQAGIANIDVVGPVPHWIGTLPRQLYLNFRKFHEVPERMDSGLDRDFLALDREMRDFSKRLGIDYLSPAAILCDAAGCVTRLGQTGDSLIAWDYAHLTDAGSRFLVARFPRIGD